MRRMDQFVALVLCLFALGTAWKAMELPIHILPRQGPGGGFFPFWLSMGIAALSIVTVLQTFVRRTAEGMDEEAPFVTPEGFMELLRVGIPGAIMVLLIDVVSIYIACAAFVFYCTFVVGRHSLRASVAIALATPVVVYAVFERLLIIPLPKGYLDVVFDLLN